MRELNIRTKKHTTVVCIDEPGAGGACHEYSVVKTEDFEQMPDGKCPTKLFQLALANFQVGAIKENGVNGCHNEDLIAIVIDRLQGFQSGQFACRENAIALRKLEEALLWLRKRTMDREARGVEGTSVL